MVVLLDQGELLQNIKNRGRDFEQEIEASYLQKINEGYMEFIKNQHSDTIKIIDISESKKFIFSNVHKYQMSMR